jgi:hypothetical protein
MDLLVQDYRHLSDKVVVKKSPIGKVDVLSRIHTVHNAAELIN